MRSVRRRRANRKPWFAIAVTVAFFAVLYLPILVVALFSLNSQRSLTVFKGFSLRWYRAFFADAGPDRLARASACGSRRWR